MKGGLAITKLQHLRAGPEGLRLVLPNPEKWAQVFTLSVLASGTTVGRGADKCGALQPPTRALATLLWRWC